MSKFSDIAAAFEARERIALSRGAKMGLSSEIDDTLGEFERLRELNADLVGALTAIRDQYRLFVGPDDAIAKFTIGLANRTIAKAKALPPAHNPMSEAMRPDDEDGGS